MSGPNLSIKAFPAVAEVAREAAPVDAATASRLATLSLTIQHAPKFLLPSIQAGERRGNLLDFGSDWSIYEDTAVPPFDSFVIEYQVIDKRQHDDNGWLDVAPDRIIACWIDRSTPGKALLRVASVYTHSTSKIWQVCPLIAGVELGPDREVNHLHFLDGGMGALAHLSNEFLPESGMDLISAARQENIRTEIVEELLHVYEMLIVLNTNNSTMRTEDPPAKLNKKRIAKGKPPLQSYHVLDVPYHSAKGPPQGGTHASPRFHMRRGHIRRLPTGRTTWVRPSAVGDPSRGSVRSDYQVRNEVAPTYAAR